MAIRQIKKCEIKCDACGKLLATMKTTTVLLGIFDGEQRFTEIRCLECSGKPILKP